MVHKQKTREESLSVPQATEKDKTPSNPLSTSILQAHMKHHASNVAKEVAAMPCPCPCQWQHTVVTLRRGKERAWGVRCLEDIL